VSASLWQTALPGTLTPLSRGALARLALSAAAGELSDKARHQVPGRSDEYSRVGEAVYEAASILERAQEVLERAVILERERGASWEAIGEAWGDIGGQSAQERFGAVVDTWRQRLHGPRDPEGTPGLPEAVEDPARYAQALDAWVVRHREPADVGGGDRCPVSGALPTASLAEQIDWLLAEGSTLRTVLAERADPARESAYLQHKAALLERIAESAPWDTKAAEAAAKARAAAQAVRVRGV
jgi:hypothetical protein